MVDTEFLADKKQGGCPNTAANKALLPLEVASGPIHEMIRDLVARHVAITSTLPVFETFVPNRAPLDAQILDAMLPDARISYLKRRSRASSCNEFESVGLDGRSEVESGFPKQHALNALHPSG